MAIGDTIRVHDKMQRDYSYDAAGGDRPQLRSKLQTRI